MLGSTERSRGNDDKSSDHNYHKSSNYTESHNDTRNFLNSFFGVLSLIFAKSSTQPPIFISKKPVFQGPSYLPVARVTTERPSTTTQTYTYGTRPTFRHSFAITNAYWSYQPYSTRNYTTITPSTTAKYEYKAPSNGIHYNGADDNNLLYE